MRSRSIAGILVLAASVVACGDLTGVDDAAAPQFGSAQSCIAIDRGQVECDPRIGDGVPPPHVVATTGNGKIVEANPT